MTGECLPVVNSALSAFEITLTRLMKAEYTTSSGREMLLKKALEQAKTIEQAIKAELAVY